MNIQQARDLKAANEAVKELKERVELLELAYSALVQAVNDRPKRGRPPNAH